MARDLKFTRGLLHLAEGEYEKGWDLYELRPSIQKRKFFDPDKNHIHHVLINSGYSHLKSSLIIILIAIF